MIIYTNRKSSERGTSSFPDVYTSRKSFEGHKPIFDAIQIEVTKRGTRRFPRLYEQKVLREGHKQFSDVIQQLQHDYPGIQTGRPPRGVHTVF